MSKRQRLRTVATVPRRKRLVTYVTVEKEIVNLGPVPTATARAVRELRDKAGLRQEDLANAIGLNRTSIANIEAGRQRILLEDVWNLAKAFGVQPLRLFMLIDKYTNQ